MSIKIALAGNPNCGKTTLFNALTGSNQYVGNWPGVTVEKKEGKLKGAEDVIIQDLPGIYSLSPYTLEEVVARSYLVGEKPDAILNIIDGTNIERNLYLTTQLIELGIPVVMAVNMIDLVRKNGDKIDLKKLSEELGCQAVEISALKNEGSEKAAQMAAAAAKAGKAVELPHVFTGSVEHAIAHIEESIQGKVDDHFLRWYAVKLFERDDKVQAELNLDKALLDHIDQHIKDCEAEMDDDAESIITNQRYAYINSVVSKAVKKKARVEHLTASDKIDQIVTQPYPGPAHLRGHHVPDVRPVHGHLHCRRRLVHRYLCNGLDQRCPVRRDRSQCSGRLPGEHRRGWLAVRPDHGRHRRRCRRGAGLCSPDAGPVLPAVHPGGCGLHVPCRLHHGPYLPPLRPVR